MFEAWKEAVEEEKHNRVIIKRCLARLQQGVLVRCFTALAAAGRRGRAKKHAVASLNVMVESHLRRSTLRRWYV